MKTCSCQRLPPRPCHVCYRRAPTRIYHIHHMNNNSAVPRNWWLQLNWDNTFNTRTITQVCARRDKLMSSVQNQRHFHISLPYIDSVAPIHDDGELSNSFICGWNSNSEAFGCPAPLFRSLLLPSSMPAAPPIPQHLTNYYSIVSTVSSIVVASEHANAVVMAMRLNDERPYADPHYIGVVLAAYPDEVNDIFSVIK